LARLPAADVSYSLGAIGDPSSPFTRQIGQVYEELRSSHTKPGNPAILIVAADADEDLASVALSLAAFAAATQRVLLIDADLDRRTLAAIDAGHSDAGLVDVALGRRHLADVVTVDRETNVSLLPFVSPNSRRDRRIADSDIRRAFDLTRRYDAVVVAAVNDGDPGLRFFAGVVDHILLVGRVNDGDQRNFEPFVARLGADARKVRGAILIAAA
jgi:Mrp family chromosome partitioning ATPase